jgi:flagellar basal body-associated protein FliL
MEYIVYNEMPYRRISQGQSRMGLCNTCGRNDRNGNKGAICFLIIILIIIIIIALVFLFYRNSSYQYQKNGFQASPKAEKDFIDITNIFQKNSNPTYSEVKNVIGDMDTAKFNQIMSNKSNLKPEMFDQF